MKSNAMIFSALIIFSMSIAYANPIKAGCTEKKKTLEKQLQYAKNAGDKRLIAGYTRSLESLTAVCDWEKRLKNQRKQPPEHQNLPAADSPAQKKTAPSKRKPSRPEYKTKSGDKN